MNKLEEARLGIRAVDKDIAALFEKRMHLVSQIRDYKKEHGLPVLDKEREAELLQAGLQEISDPELRQYYPAFQRGLMAISRKWQARGPWGDYDIKVGKNHLDRVGEYFDLRRKVMVISDKGVPVQYVQTVLAACREPHLLIVPEGERSKGLPWLERILGCMLENGFTREDAVIAVGGGMVGDLAGLAAAVYMRGVDWYDVPTTLLAQVDASAGGKTAVNLEGAKNVVGAFHHPGGVLIDTDTLKSLSPRVFAEGLAELAKMAVTFDEPLFCKLEDAASRKDWNNIDSFIKEALRIKIRVVEQDPTEKDLRASLNFGHTVGHAIEALGRGKYLHGEAVAIGMLYMASAPVRERLEHLFTRIGLPLRDSFTVDELMAAASKDKKRLAAGFKTVKVDKVGSFRFEKVSEEGLRSIIQSFKQL